MAADEPAPVLDLPRVVELALAQNPALMAEAERQAEVAGGVDEAAADAWPQLDLVGSWSRARDPAFLNSPDFEDMIVHVEARTPQDIENEVGLTEGNIFQGELTFDQLLFNRPVPGYAQYRGPVDGLYMCGSSTHPGGGVMGAPGANAAREVLADLKIKGEAGRAGARWMAS